MDKRGQFQVLANPKTIAYTLGAGFIGYLLFQSVESFIIGGLIGLFLSFVT